MKIELLIERDTDNSFPSSSVVFGITGSEVIIKISDSEREIAVDLEEFKTMCGTIWLMPWRNLTH